MSIVNCLSCNKKISSRADICPHCGFSKGNVSAQDSDRKHRYKQYLKIQSINTQAALAVLLFVAGFAYMYWKGENPSEEVYYIGYSISAAGFIWYIVNRVRMVLVKRARR